MTGKNSVSKNHFRSFIVNDAFAAFSDSASAEIDLNGTSLCGMYIPSEFKGKYIDLLAAPREGGEYFPIIADGKRIRIPVEVKPTMIPLDVYTFIGIQYLKLVSSDKEYCSIILSARPI